MVNKLAPLVLAASLCLGAFGSISYAASPDKVHQAETTATGTATQSDLAPQTTKHDQQVEILRLLITDNTAAFEKSYEQMRTAVAHRDSQAFAALLNFPASFNVNGKREVIDTRQEFIRRYKSLISPAVEGALAKTAFDDLSINSHGVMAGSGEIWFSVNDHGNGNFCLVALNSK